MAENIGKGHTQQRFNSGTANICDLPLKIAQGCSTAVQQRHSEYMKEDLIKIIPKSKPITSKKVVLLLWLCFFLAAFSAGAYLWINFEKKSLANEIKDIEAEIAVSGPDKETEKELKKTAKKINDFANVLQGHKNPSRFFDFLRNISHAKVVLSELYLSVPEMKATLAGETISFKTLAEQILVLSLRQGVENIEIDAASLNREGKVEFDLNFNFPEEFIKK